MPSALENNTIHYMGSHGSEKACLLLCMCLGCEWVGMPRLGSRLSTYWPTKWFNKWWCSQHTSAKQISIPCLSVESPELKTKGRVCEERALGLSSEASNCSDVGTGDLDVPNSHKASLMKVTRTLYPHILSAIGSLCPRNQKRKRA